MASTLLTLTKIAIQALYTMYGEVYKCHWMICVTTPWPMVLPPSRRVNRWPVSSGISFLRVRVSSVSSPGITISTPAKGRERGEMERREEGGECTWSRLLCQGARDSTAVAPPSGRVMDELTLAVRVNS